jgi:hypothetical protein
MIEGDVHRFKAPILFRRGARMRKHFIPIPDDIAERLRTASTRRMIVALNDQVFRRIWQNTKEMGPCLFLSKQMLRNIAGEQGDMVEVEMEIDPEPDHVEICEELQVALQQDGEAARRFYSVTPGRQRSLAHYVNSAKRVETRIKRSLDLAYKLRTETL